MKKIKLVCFCLIFGSVFAQVDEKLITEATINQEITKAKKLSTKNIKKTIEISKNTYRLSKIIDYNMGMLESNIILMAKYFDIGNFKKVIELSKETERLAIETEHNEILSDTYRLRASSYTELGVNDESHKEFLKALRITEKINSKNYKYYQQALIYSGLGSYSAHINAPIDSVIHYQKKSLENVLKMDESKDFINKKYYTLALNYMNLGMTSNASHHPQDAEEYFSKALEICLNKNYQINKDIEITILNEFAWLYYDQKEYDKSVRYANEAVQMEKQMSLPYIRRDLYEVMFKSYVEAGQKERSSTYMNLYTKLNDSLVNAEKKALNTPIAHIVNEQEQTNANNIQKILIIVSFIIIVIALTTWFFWRINQNKLHKKYQTIIQSLAQSKMVAPLSYEIKISPKNSPEKVTMITDHTTQLLLEKLQKFEQSKKFIKKEVSRVYLANSLNTNTKYLSEIIRQHTGKNFNNYINGLRIQYITELLYNDPIYREYKISYLAEACGFASREVFAVTFKKETGITPSYFISQLKTDEGEKEL